MDIVRGWHDADNPLFRFQGGRLLAIAFPTVPERFEAKLLSLFKAEGEAAASFVAGILENYKGEPFTHRICQVLVEAVPENDDRLGSVEVALLSTGVVSGEFGMVEAYQAKKDAIAPWRGPSTKSPRFRRAIQTHAR